MTEHQLREALAKSLRKLDPDSELLRSFWSALHFRQENAGLHEAESGTPGLKCALKIALTLSCQELSEEILHIPPVPPVDPPTPDLSHELAVAVELLPEYVLTNTLLHAKYSGQPLENQTDVQKILESALKKYAQCARLWLSGPF